MYHEDPLLSRNMQFLFFRDMAIPGIMAALRVAQDCQTRVLCTISPNFLDTGLCRTRDTLVDH